MQRLTDEELEYARKIKPLLLTEGWEVGIKPKNGKIIYRLHLGPDETHVRNFWAREIVQMYGYGARLVSCVKIT